MTTKLANRADERHPAGLTLAQGADSRVHVDTEPLQKLPLQLHVPFREQEAVKPDDFLHPRFGRQRLVLRHVADPFLDRERLLGGREAEDADRGNGTRLLLGWHLFAEQGAPPKTTLARYVLTQERCA